eukprot:5831409-Pyramimonas_sp.AAC.1
MDGRGRNIRTRGRRRQNRRRKRRRRKRMRRNGGGGVEPLKILQTLERKEKVKEGGEERRGRSRGQGKQQ